MLSYSDEKYWNDRYSDGINHTWYYQYEDFAPIIDPLIGDYSAILEIGCGDAPVVASIARVGHKRKLHAIDFSAKVINELEIKYKDSNLQFSRMDARKMKYQKSSFNIIIDKGTIDAMLCDKNMNKAYKNVSQILQESIRVLNTTTVGYLIIISHISPDSEQFLSMSENCIMPICDMSPEVIWSIDAHTGCTQDNGTVYVLKCTPRRITRSVTYGTSIPEPVTMKIHEYDLDDEDDEMYCQPCT